METDARIDLYIRGLQNKGENTEFHECIKGIVHSSIRTEKLRLGMWEERDAELVAGLDIVKKADEREINNLRTELENINAIYFLGCSKLIRAKQKMDWKDRNPNIIGKRRKKKNRGISRRELNINNKNKSVNEILKDSNDITEAEIRKKSDRKRKRKIELRESQDKKNEAEVGSREVNLLRIRRANSARPVGKSSKMKGKKDNFGTKPEKPEKQSKEDEEERRKKKRWNPVIISKGVESRKKRRTTSEDIRIFFGTEDSH